MVHAANYFEYSLRFPGQKATLDNDPIISKSDGYMLYLRFLEVLREVPESREDYRRVYVEIIKIFDDYLFEKTKTSFKLNHLICVDPVCTESEREVKASDRFYVSYEVMNYPHHFVLDRADNQCSFFFNKQFPLQSLHMLLDQLNYEQMMQFK